MNYLFALFVVASLEGGETKYTHIKTYEDRHMCEIAQVVFQVTYELQENETLECVKVDE